MDWQTIISIGLTVLGIAVGFLSTYYKTKADLQGKATALIGTAEGMYTGAAKAGGKRFEWVVDQLYGITPAWLKPLLTRETIGNIVQTAFGWMQDFARQQLDKATDKVTE